MILNVTRTMKWHKYEFLIKGNDTVRAESKFNYGILPRKIKVESQEAIYAIFQTNWVMKLISLIPLLFLEIGLFPKYKISKDASLIGESRISFFSPVRKLVIQESVYEFYLHNNNYISIMKDNVQFALIKRDALSVAEKSKYRVDFDKTIVSDVAIILLFVSFVDIIYYPNRFRVDAVTYEKTFGKDEFHDRTLWSSN